jgi:hypothetical protein
MGWNDCDEITYEITDKDKEEYEKRIQLLPKVNITSHLNHLINIYSFVYIRQIIHQLH